MSKPRILAFSGSARVASFNQRLVEYAARQAAGHDVDVTVINLRLGGVRGLVHVRAILNNLGVLVLPEQVPVSQAADAFDDAGNLVRESDSRRVAELVAAFVEALGRLGDT